MTDSHATRLIRRLLTKYDRLVSSWRPPRWFGVTVLFGVLLGSWLSARNLGIAWFDLNWTPLAFASLLGLILVWLNAMEYWILSDIAGQRATFSEAWRVACISAISNLIPLPLGAAYRLHMVRSGGGSGRIAVQVTAAMSLIWLAIASGIVAGVSLGSNALRSGSFLGVVAVMLFTAGVQMLPRHHRHPSAVMRIAGVEAAFVGQAVARVLLVSTALQIGLTAGQASYFAATSALSSAIGILPGGIGLWELLTAAASPLIGIASSAGFLIAGTVRLTNITAYAIAFLAWLLISRLPSTEVEPHI